MEYGGLFSVSPVPSQIIMVCMICLWAVIGISRRNIVERAAPHQSTETGSWLNWTEKFPAQYTTVPPGNSILTNRYSAAECFKNKTQLKDKSLGKERYRAYLIQKVVSRPSREMKFMSSHTGVAGPRCISAGLWKLLLVKHPLWVGLIQILISLH